MKSRIVIRLLIAALLAFQWQIATWITAAPEPAYAYDWTPADVTVTYHMTGGMTPITDLTLTDLGFVSVSANWTPGGTYTMLRGLRDGIPSSITDGELIYYGPSSTVNITGMQLDLYDYGVAAWTYAADNVTYLESYDTATIGGDGVDEIANEITGIATSVNDLSTTFGGFSTLLTGTIIPIALLLIITFFGYWHRDKPLLLIGGIGWMIYGFSYWSTYWWLSVILVLSGFAIILKTALDTRKQNQ